MELEIFWVSVAGFFVYFASASLIYRRNATLDRYFLSFRNISYELFALLFVYWLVNNILKLMGLFMFSKNMN